MSLFARLMSRDYRRGLAAEAAGDLHEAASAYRRAGRTLDLLRVQRQLVASAREPRERAEHLRLAALYSIGVLSSREVRGLQHDLALALESVPDDPAAFEEAIQLLVLTGDHLRAGELLWRHERTAEARRVLAEGRHFERLEELDRAEAERLAAEHVASSRLSHGQAELAAGRRSAARDALAGAGGEMASALTADLDARLPGARVALVPEGSRPATFVRGEALVLGRLPESPLPLRDPGISRQHVRIEVTPDGARLEDLGSKNGTFVDGLPLAAPVTLADDGAFELGERCRVRHSRLEGGALLLEVDRGLSTGARAVLLDRPVALAALWPGLVGSLAPHGAWFELTAPDLRLDGASVASVELLAGDRVEVGGVSVEVRRS